MTLHKDIIWGSMGVLGLLLICIGSVDILPHLKEGDSGIKQG